MPTVSTGRPYPHCGLDTTADWMLHAPVEWVDWADVTTTQNGVYIAALLADADTLDPHPHVVAWRGTLYLEDGHTRMCRSLLTRQTGMLCRVRRVAS